MSLRGVEERKANEGESRTAPLGLPMNIPGATISTNCFASIACLVLGQRDRRERSNKERQHPNGCGEIELVGLNVGGVIVGSNNNRVKENLVSGNGYSNPSENDFGIAVGFGNNNLIEKNAVVRNTVGIRLRWGGSWQRGH